MAAEVVSLAKQRGAAALYEDYLRECRAITRLRFQGFPELEGPLVTHNIMRRKILLDILEVYEDEIDNELALAKAQAVPRSRVSSSQPMLPGMRTGD